MHLKRAYFVLFVSLAFSVDFSGMSVSAVSRHDDIATLRHSLQQMPEWSWSRGVGVARSRQFRRAFKRSLVQIFGMTARPQRQATSGGDHVPAYMRWLYEESAVGRLPAVLRQLSRRRSSLPYRQKRHSHVTANTVRSFTGKYASNSPTNSSLH